MIGRSGDGIRVLVAGVDGAEAKDLVREVTCGNGFPCTVGSCGFDEVLVRVGRERPHLVVCAIRSGRTLRDGLIRRIRQGHPGVRVLVVGGSDEPETILPALRQGADGYVQRGDPAISLHEAVRRVLGEDPPLSRGVVMRVLEHLRDGTGPVELPEGILTPRQRQVVEFLSEGWTDKEMADRLGISADAVKQHVAAVKRKLKVRSRPQIAGWYGRGAE